MVFEFANFTNCALIDFTMYLCQHNEMTCLNYDLLSARCALLKEGKEGRILRYPENNRNWQHIFVNFILSQNWEMKIKRKKSVTRGVFSRKTLVPKELFILQGRMCLAKKLWCDYLDCFLDHFVDWCFCSSSWLREWQWKNVFLINRNGESINHFIYRCIHDLVILRAMLITRLHPDF